MALSTRSAGGRSLRLPPGLGGSGEDLIAMEDEACSLLIVLNMSYHDGVQVWKEESWRSSVPAPPRLTCGPEDEQLGGLGRCVHVDLEGRKEEVCLGGMKTLRWN